MPLELLVLYDSFVMPAIALSGILFVP